MGSKRVIQYAELIRGGHTTMLRRLQMLLAVALIFNMASQAFAISDGSISNEVLSSYSLGQGGVGVAGQGGDLGSVYANPAALTTLKGTQASVGLAWEN